MKVRNVCGLRMEGEAEDVALANRTNGAIAVGCENLDGFAESSN